MPWTKEEKSEYNRRYHLEHYPEILARRRRNRAAEIERLGLKKRDAYVLTLDGETLKVCGKCAEPKPTSEFHRDKRRPDGRFPWCRDCRMTVPYYRTNPEKRRQYRQTAVSRLRANSHGQARRAQMRKSRVEYVDYAAIILRDRGRCHICGKKVKATELTLDHLIPLADGGPHAAANLAVAHRKCNAKKNRHARIPSQLRLIG